MDWFGELANCIPLSTPTPKTTNSLQCKRIFGEATLSISSQITDLAAIVNFKPEAEKEISIREAVARLRVLVAR